jgi:hypothetical protein
MLDPRAANYCQDSSSNSNKNGSTMQFTGINYFEHQRQVPVIQTVTAVDSGLGTRNLPNLGLRT